MIEDTLELLEEELSRAQVVSPAEVPPTVVTMNSVVLFQDLEIGPHILRQGWREAPES